MNLSGGKLCAPAPPQYSRVISDTSRDNYESPETPSFYGPGGDEVARGFTSVNMDGRKHTAT